MKIATAVETKVAEIRCPRCQSSHLAIAGPKATCRICSTVWDWRETKPALRGKR